MSILRPEDEVFDLRGDLFYDGQWNRIPNEDLRGVPAADGGITISRGHRDESTALTPGTATFSLNNLDGKYSLRQPTSPLYDKLNRNTPVRFYLGEPHVGGTNFDDVDTTDHVAPSLESATDDAIMIYGWACPDGSGTYTPPGSTVDTRSVFGSGFTMMTGYELISSVGATGTRTGTFSAAEDYVAASVLLHGNSPTVTNFTGSGVGAGAGDDTVEVDGVAGQWWVYITYMASLLIVPSIGVDPIALETPQYPQDTDGGGWILLGNTGPIVVGDVQAETIQMKAWIKRVKTTGTHQIRIQNLGDNFDFATGFLQVSDVDYFTYRFHGEIAEWPVTWVPGSNADVGDVWAPVTASGISRRIARARTTARNANERLIALPSSQRALIGYWPINDERGSARAHSEVVGQQSLGSPDMTRRPSYARGDIGPWMPQGASGINDAFNGILEGNISGGQQSTPFSGRGGWSADVLYRTEDPARWEGGNPQQFTLDVDTVLAVSFGTIETRWRLLIDPESEEIQLGAIRIDSGIVINITSAPLGTLLNGQVHHLRMSTVYDSATWSQLTAYVDGLLVASVSIDAASPFVPDPTVIRIIWNAPNDNFERPIDFGQLILWGPRDDGTMNGWQGPAPLPEVAAAAALGHVGETPANRIQRICFEESIPVAISGPISTIRMGPQYPAGTLEIMQEAADTGMGTLYEAREFDGYVYLTLPGLYNLNPTIELDHSAVGEVLPSLLPVDDDEYVVNDVTASNRDGGDFRAVQRTGPLNVNDPGTDPDGIGRYDESYTVNVQGSIRLGNQATWRLHLGTVDEARYPVVSMDTASMLEFANDGETLFESATTLDTGNRLDIINPPNWLPPDDIAQLMRGYEERIEQFRWTLDANCVPNSPYTIGIIEQSGNPDPSDQRNRYSPLNSEVATDFDSGVDTSLEVTDNTGDNDLWSLTTVFPFDIEVAGVILRVTGIAGASSPQTITVQQDPINGVVKTIPAGSKVELAHQVYRGV